MCKNYVVFLSVCFAFVPDTDSQSVCLSLSEKAGSSESKIITFYILT